MKDIQHLKFEIVCTRYELIRYLEHLYDEFLQSDILSNLAGRYSYDPAYKVYIQLLYNNQDPMELDEWVEHILALSHSHEDSEN